MTFLVLYVDDILLVENNAKRLTEIKQLSSLKFQVKDFGEAECALGL